MDRQKIIAIMNSEMKLATGCTEPAAVALAAAVASEKLGEKIESIQVLASSNIIKNAMAAGIPGTSFTGMDYAAACGALGGKSEKQLQVIDGLSESVKEEVKALVLSGKVNIGIAQVPEKLYIDVTVSGAAKTARAVISGDHTNVILVQVDGVTEYVKGENDQTHDAGDGISPEQIIQTLSVDRIYQFCQELDPDKDDLSIVKQSIEVNSAIAEEGLAGDYGLKVGKMIEADCIKGIIADDMVSCAMKLASAGSDARMAGANIAVVSNSGSGNQGITATMPVVGAARKLGSSEKQLLRAVALSNLIVIYIKAKFGRLSGLCGATVAGIGAACGAVYLLGGNLEHIKNAIQNMVGNVTGMICDGAKADCALKISTCTHAAMQAARMAMHGIRVGSTDGIVEEDVEKTIDNFAKLGNEGSLTMDQMVLQMMLDKN